MKKILFTLALVSLAAGAAFAQAPAARGGSRDRVPALPAEEFKLESLKGRVVLMACWKTPGEARARMLPWLNRLQEDFGDKGLTVVAVNLNDKSAGASDAFQTLHPRMQVVLDPTRRMFERQELAQVPAGVLYDRAGEVILAFEGFKSEDPETLTPVIEAMVLQPVEEEEKK